VKLEQGMTRGEGHGVDFRGIPRRDNEAATVGFGFDLLDNALDLIDPFVVRPAPIAPLGTVDTAKLSLLVRPFIPNRDPALAQIIHVRVAAEEPEEFMNDRLEMQLFGREQRKTCPQIVTRLGAKNGKGPRAGAIAPRPPLFQNKPEQIMVLPHVTDELPNEL